MAEVRVETEIAAPVKKVFDYVGDVTTHPLYADFVKGVRITSPIKKGKGVVFVQSHHGTDKEIASEIIEYDPPKKIVWVAREPSAEVRVSYFFEKTPGGTHLLHTINSKAFDDPARFKKTVQNNEIELANLKKILEKG